MKTKKMMFAVAGLALGLCAATAASLGLNNSVEEVDAAVAAPKTFYLDCAKFTDYDDAQSIGLHYWGGGTDARKEATKVADNYWKCEISDITGLTNIQWFRCPTGNTGGAYNDNWQNAGSIDNDYYRVTGWQNSGTWYASETFSEGDKLYVDARGSTKFSDDTYVDGTGTHTLTTYFYGWFFNNSATVLAATRVGTTNLSYITFTGTTRIVGFEFVRGEGFSGASWDAPYKVDQSADIYFTTSNQDKFAFKLEGYGEYGDDKDKVLCSGQEEFTAGYVSDCFAYYFLQNTASYCSGVLDPEVQATIGSNYNNLMGLHDGAAYTFYTSDVNLGYDKTYVSLSSQALTRYANMLKDRSNDYSDATFLNLGENSPIKAYNVSSQVSNPVTIPTTAIMIACFAAITVAAGAFLIVRKKNSVE